MKICVTAAESGLDAQVDSRFGRCRFFTIVDPDTLLFESIENAGIAASGGAGIQAAQFIANKGVETVCTGNVGPNASMTLEAAGIKVIVGVSGTVREVVEAYKGGKLQPPASGPSVPSHFGTVPGGTGASVKTEEIPKKASIPSGDNELNALKEQSEAIRSQLNQIIQKIDKLGKRENPPSKNGPTGISQIKKTLEKK